MRQSILAILFAGFLAILPPLHAEPIIRVGSGSYTAALPKGASLPPVKPLASPTVKGKMPTNDWWSALAWTPFGERHYPHPLAVQAGPKGLRVFYPGTNISANKAGIFGFMPDKTGDDLALGHSAVAEFPDARVDGFSDWFVAVRFGADQKTMRVTYGHGSPFVFAAFDGGAARLTFAKAPKVWAGDDKSAVLGITVNGKHYGLFGPAGSTWTGLGKTTLTNESAKSYFSLAILPDDTKETLALFQRHAYAHVADTRVAWAVDMQASEVTTTFTATTTVHEGKEDSTLFALYPHQWRHSDAPLLGKEYPSVRGKMKLCRGKTFRTRLRFPGVLPALPDVGACDKQRIEGYLKAEADAKVPTLADTYADGKWLGRTACLIPLAEQCKLDAVTQTLRERLRSRLEEWLAVADSAGKPKAKGLFHYDERWGTLIGYPASFGSDKELNDHHFHYGYFLRAAAEVARHDPAWAKDDRWGGMVKLLIRDIAAPDRADPLFPFLRCFDPYAGHSWASGHAKFGDGNNHESSSEAMNAWFGLVLWGEATGDAALRDLGMWLYTTEMTAIQEYWFDVHGDNFPKSYPASVVTMVWGGKGANATWFSAKPEHIHGINWLPIHAGSLYLGRHPAYVRKNYDALVKEKSGAKWDDWADVIWMYRALVDADDALKQFEERKDTAKFDTGGSRAHAYHWIATLKQLGEVDAAVTANHPLAAVFRKGEKRTYCVYNMAEAARTVTFSDKVQMQVKGRGFAVKRGK
jgi:endoglucanase Acf2